MTTITRKPPKKEANRLTRLWQEHGPNTYPLDISELIDGALQTSDFSGELETKVGCYDSFEGCLVRTANTEKWTILLNSEIENKRRQRFTYAHELGHFMCHRGLRDRFEDSDETLNDFGFVPTKVPNPPQEFLYFFELMGFSRLLCSRFLP